jgi:ABC-type Fe3+-hydroxamate transport system substrate-binding protein
MVRRRLTAVALLALLLPASVAASPSQRVVSLNPSLTAILLAIGAGGTVVGVDDWSGRQHPDLAHLPRVGGLFNPSLESVVALEPDLVVLVPSAQQRALRDRLRALGIEVAELPNIGLEELLGSIETLGALVGRPEQAAERVAAIRRFWDETSRATAGRPRVRAVVVIQRDPLYVVGRGSFIHSMLRAAGAENPGSAFAEPYPRTDLEWLIAAAPDVILDASEGGEEALAYWSRWPSLPAVGKGRVVAIPASQVMLPGPYLDRGLRILAESIHGRGVLH